MDVLMKKLQRFWKLLFAVGVLSILVGLNIFLPLRTSEHIQRLVAVMLLLGAGMTVAYTVTIHSGKNMASGLLLTVVRVVVAMLLLFHPLDTNLTFTTLMGIYFGIEGALVMGEAVRMKNIRVLSVITSVIGITGILFSALIWLWLKGASYFAISTLLAVIFWVRGATQIFTALKFKNYKSPEEMAAAPQPPPGDEAPAAAPKA
jgi:uncharacterized membrane protein HdeD (DUF308 family)